MSPRDIADVEDITTEPAEIPCAGGTLAGTLFRPAGEIRAAVLIGGATGVTHIYYHAFARWLASTERVAVLTFDYSDFGASATGPLRRARATMADWGIRDLTAARRHLAARFPAAPIWLIGHSLGAMMLHLHSSMDRVERIIAVASGPAYWRHHPMPFRLLAFLFWFGHAPLAARVLGYLPGSLLGFGADLPPGVYWQWRRWCTSPLFNASEIGRTLPERPGAPIAARKKFVAIADDVMIPPRSVWRLMAQYADGPKRQSVIRPRDFGLKRIGHIGPFARRNAAIWPEIIRDFTPPHPATG